MVDDEGAAKTRQPILWQALYEQTLSQGQSNTTVAICTDFIEALANQQVPVTTPAKTSVVFGISSLPPRYMDALKALGEQIDVNLASRTQVGLIGEILIVLKDLAGLMQSDEKS
ncbi:exodeoxyribonuclease V subunit gamma [Vibrio lentus]|nr:exodeoxyribonuclease V subunit gamma [Vibrio lentus]